MTEKELKSLEEKLVSSDYKKYTTCLSSKEAYGWFKSIKRNSEILFTIEFRIWDFRQFPQCPDPFAYDVLILNGDSKTRIDLEITSPKFDIETTEKIAWDLNKMLNPYIINELNK